MAFANGVIAQTEAERDLIRSNYDLPKLKDLTEQFDRNFNKEKAAALKAAALYGWKESIELPNGGIAILVGIFDDGTPKYYRTYNREAGITTRTDRVQTGGSLGLNLNGENMIGGIWDGGRVRNTHILLENRVTQMDNPSSFSDHSTHVSGTMIGTGNVVDGAAKGMAPMAELIAYDFNNDESEMTAAAANGLLISNHSYGYKIELLPLWYLGYYDSSARNLDIITFNAPYYLPVCSAGNDRQSGQNSGDGGYDYLTGYAVSKNSIVCAAVYQVLNYNGPASVYMSSFSSWGPTDDGRVKPDISGKGVNTYSSTAASNNSFASYDGTSMSAPNISGSLLLLQQHYNNLNGSFMLSSTLRGLALHTADEAGTNPGPDYRFGWGLLNTERAASVITNNGDKSVIIEEQLAQDEVYTFSVQADGINDLVASITWTDPAGTSLPSNSHDKNNPMLVNDLDLRISKDGGDTFYPWKLNPAIPSAPATQEDNIVDNIEKLEIPNASGEYIIRVSHKNILRNGIQAFSLIVTGIVREDFAVTTHQGFQKFCAAENSVTYDIDLSFFNDFTDTINFTVSNVPNGTNATITPNALSANGTVTLTMDDIDALLPGDYQLKITATGTIETVNVYPILHIIDSQLAAVALESPDDNALDQPLDLTFNWEDISDDVEIYDFQLALDANFNSIVVDTSIEENQTTVEDLLNETEYFWRVQATSICGEGDYSEVYSFTTEAQLGVEENLIEGLVIYPNPTTSILNIEANNIIDSVQIFNVLGQTLITESLNSAATLINTGDLSAGNYFVKITSQGMVTVKQFVKN